MNIYIISLHLIFAICTLCITAITGQAKTEIQGYLKTVTITDSVGDNTPPVASFTYSQDGASFTFDASNSSDPDGNITKYDWNFGDGAIASGVTVNHQFADLVQSSPVTLTVVDNLGGVALNQMKISVSNSVYLRPIQSLISQWTSISGLNYSTVDDLIADDNNYNSTVKSWAVDKFEIEDIGIQSRTISKVVIHMRAKASQETSKFRITLGVSLDKEFTSGDIALTTSFKDVMFEVVASPITQQQWTYSEINNLILAYRTLSIPANTTIFVSQVYLEVIF